jgi:ABC-type phosphate transport system substrate-binding protein
MLARFRPAVALIIGSAALATVLSTAGPASARTLTDPPSTPPKSDLVGVGSDTTQDVIGLDGETLAKSGFASNYNATDPASKLWSFDAFGDPAEIVTSEGCDPITRPSGSSAGIAALKADEAAGTNCIDYARSSRVKNPATDGDLVFVPFARDGVTWATFPVKEGGKKFNAPTNLATADLTAIYSCTVTNWSQVGGKDAPIIPFLPQSGSGTRSFFLAAIGVATPGGCVQQPEGLEENNGEMIPEESRPNAILPYSIARYSAQKSGVSDDVRAGATLRNIDGRKPIAKGKLNADFAPAFLRLVFNVLKPADMPSQSFKKVFGTKGFICKNPDITRTFGFGTLPKKSCGY